MHAGCQVYFRYYEFFSKDINWEIIKLQLEENPNQNYEVFIDINLSQYFRMMQQFCMKYRQQMKLGN